MKKVHSGLLILAIILAALNLRPAINSISPIMDILQANLGMNALVVSLLTSLPVLCMGMFSPLAAKLGIKWGMEKVIMYSIILIGVGTFLRLFAGSSIFLLLTAFLAGVGIATASPLLSGFIKKYFAHKVSAIISVYTVAMAIGAALGSGLTVPLMDLSSTNSWQWALSFWFVFAGIALILWVYLVLRIKPASSTNASLEQNSRLPWTNGRAWLLTGFFGLMAAIFYSCTAWLAPAVQEMGYSKAYSGTVLSIFMLVQIPANILIPMIAQKYSKHVSCLLFCAALEVVGLLLIIFSVGNPMIAAIFIGLGAGGLFPLALMLPIVETSNANEASTWSAMTQSVGYVIGSCGPLLLGWVLQLTGSFKIQFIVLLVICCVMMVFHVAIGINNSSKAKKALEAIS